MSETREVVTSGLFVAFERGSTVVTRVQARSNRMALYDYDDYLPPVSTSKSPKLGIPSSEGIGIDFYSVYLIPCPPGEG